jgi:putative ABC transport system substrate-binding protein
MVLICTLALLFAGILVLALPRAQGQPSFPFPLHEARNLTENTAVPHRPFGLTNILTLGFLLVFVAAVVQPAAKVPRKIGLVTGTGPTVERLRREAAFRQGLLERGYIEGQDITIVKRYAEGQFSRLPDLALDLVETERVDVIVATGTDAVAASKAAVEKADATIPIVMTHVGDPVGRKFVNSLPQPGGKITGLSNVSDQLAGKLLELLKEVVPRLSRVAILSNPPQPAHRAQLEALQGMAGALAIQLHNAEANGPGEIESALTTVCNGKDWKPEALIVLSSGLHIAHSRRIADCALKAGVPAISWDRAYAENGLLMTYGPDEQEIFQRAAYYVDRILNREHPTSPADLPVERPTAFELIINLRTAQHLGINVPPSLLLLAKEVIR